MREIPTPERGNVGAAPLVAIESARVAELRRYSLRPGAGPTLQKLFTDHLISGQRQAGMLIGPVYTDLDDPDRFVWWRAFTDMEARLDALTAFYHGPVWAARRDEANGTMIDSDDVLLLRPLGPPRGRVDLRRPFPSPPAGASTALMVLHGRSADSELGPPVDVLALVESILRAPILTWSTEFAANTFPQLPVRAGSAFVWTADFGDTNDMTAALGRLRGHADWTEWRDAGDCDMEVMRLRAAIPGQGTSRH